MSKNTDKLNHPLLLALETSGRLGSVALAEGDRLLDESSFTTPLRHSAEVFPAIAALLEKFNRKPEQIRHIYISIGPGSFTGLRIAATIAKSMHLANNNIKIVAVDTLDVIAANLEANRQYKNIATILDAKRNQFFVARYEILHRTPNGGDTRYEKIGTDTLMTAKEFKDKFANTDAPIWLLGEGLVYYKDKFTADGIYFFDQKYWAPSARKVHLLGRHLARTNQFADPLTLTPTYLRNPVVKPK